MFVISRTFCHVTPAMNFSPQMTVCNREFYFRKSAMNSHILISPCKPFFPWKRVFLRGASYFLLSPYFRGTLFYTRAYFFIFYHFSHLPFSSGAWRIFYRKCIFYFLSHFLSRESIFYQDSIILFVHQCYFCTAFPPGGIILCTGAFFLKHVSSFPLHSLQLHFSTRTVFSQGHYFLSRRILPFFKGSGRKLGSNIKPC